MASWTAYSKQIPQFNRYFYVYDPPRRVEEMEGELSVIEEEIGRLLGRGSTR